MRPCMDCNSTLPIHIPNRLTTRHKTARRCVQDSLNPAGDRGLSDFDARNRFVVNFIYDLPALKHNRVFEGWQVGSIISDQSGNPLDW